MEDPQTVKSEPVAMAAFQPSGAVGPPPNQPRLNLETADLI
jgi:hypothetical protein